MADLKKLKAEILADGTIDEPEVARLRAELYADGKIDKEEVDFLMEQRNASPSWRMGWRNWTEREQAKTRC